MDERVAGKAKEKEIYILRQYGIEKQLLSNTNYFILFYYDVLKDHHGFAVVIFLTGNVGKMYSCSKINQKAFKISFKATKLTIKYVNEILNKTSSTFYNSLNNQLIIEGTKHDILHFFQNIVYIFYCLYNYLLKTDFCGLFICFT